ncbi:MAG: hypothetical protein JXB05_03950 [Myxococcaceae bacterium]|nr:hypothetical protein [Myxococcaceae bacterium]
MFKSIADTPAVHETRRLSLQQALQDTFAGLNHLQLVHERRRSFRWFSLVQLVFGGFLFVLCLPVLLYVAFRLGMIHNFFEGTDPGGGGDGEASSSRQPRERGWRGSPTSWFFSYWHQLRLRGFRQELGAVPEFEAAYWPQTEQECAKVTAAVLERADTHGLVVLETIGTEDPQEQETAETWFGAQPLLARPEVRHEAQSAEHLRGHGFELREAQGQVELLWSHPTHKRWEAALALLFYPLLRLFSLVEHTGLGDLWGDLLGRPPRQTRLVVRAESLHVEQVRNGRVLKREGLEGKELLGITFSPRLGHDRAARFLPPSLRLLGRGGRVVEVRLPELPVQGRHVRDFLLATTLRLRREHPEAGLPTEPRQPGRCPRCSTAYLMGPGLLCPSCSTWAGAFR